MRCWRSCHRLSKYPCRLSRVARVGSPNLPRRCPTGGFLGKAQFQGSVDASQTDANREKKIGDERPLLQMRFMDVIVDNRLHPELHMEDPGQDEEQHDDRRNGMP